MENNFNENDQNVYNNIPENLYNDQPENPQPQQINLSKPPEPTPQQSPYIENQNVMPEQPYYNQVPMTPPPESPEEIKKKANTLCLIDTILMFGPGIVSAILLAIFSILNINVDGSTVNNINTSDSILGGLYALVSGINSLAKLASFVLMIVIRIKYPQSVWGKVLMWIFIAEAILVVIGAALLIFACTSSLRSCSGGY